MDFSGDIVWDEATNGVFTLIVFWLIKSGKQILSRDSFPAKMEYVMGTRLSAFGFTSTRSDAGETYCPSSQLNT